MNVKKKKSTSGISYMKHSYTVKRNPWMFPGNNGQLGCIKIVIKYKNHAY